MQRVFILLPFFLLSIGARECNEKKNENEKKDGAVVYKGRLEIKAMCMNYTIKLLKGNIGPSKIAGNWTDASTQKTYTNVFGLEDPCNFPDSIKQGDEFYFVIDNTKTKPCAICMLYYPVPEEKLSIKIVNK